MLDVYTVSVLAMVTHKSVVWRMFSENPVDNKRATCALCNENVAHGGKNVGSFSTSNLWQHLSRSHKDTYNQLKEEEKNGSTAGGEAKNSTPQQRAPPIFGRAAITLGIGPHSSLT